MGSCHQALAPPARGSGVSSYQIQCGWCGFETTRRPCFSICVYLVFNIFQCHSMLAGCRISVTSARRTQTSRFRCRLLRPASDFSYRNMFVPSVGQICLGGRKRRPSFWQYAGTCANNLGPVAQAPKQASSQRQWEHSSRPGLQQSLTLSSSQIVSQQ